jgi:2-phospho-L-lactate guanylyltransferase
VLDQREREGLVLAMLRDVLTVIHNMTVFDGVLVVSRSPKVRAIAREFGVETYVESAGSDHSRAVTEASRYLNDERHPRHTLALPGDVPHMNTGDVCQIISGHNRVTLVPNESGEGTNAVLASPPNVITYHFGMQSLRKHARAARAAGIVPSIVRNANIAKDIDEPQDLLRARAELPPSFTRDYMECSGIAARIVLGDVSALTNHG